MGEFAQGLIRFKVKTEDQASKAVRKLVLDMFGKRIVRSWPVDTGRSRANNQISLNDLPTSAIMAFDKEGTVTIEAGNHVLATYKLGDTIFIYNNVSYAMALEYGHSSLAPQGCYRLAVQAVLSAYGGAGA